MPLTGASVLITRPVGQGRTLARQVLALGGRAVLLPGVSLCIVPETTAADLRAALQDDLVIFTSPAAVRFAARLTPLHGRARVAAVGAGTARMLARHGVTDILVPRTTQNSEGLLAHVALSDVHERRVALVGAPGGRGTLQQVLHQRGARVREVQVYRRVPARLDRRHREAVRGLRGDVYMLLSSAETLDCLRTALEDADWQRIVAARAVVSSERMGVAVRQAGFKHVKLAGSALSVDLLACAVQWHAAS